MTDSEVRLLGIRHLGPGSARSVVEALAEMQPDCILIEGPPDAHSVLPLVVHTDMRPPVSLLIYSPESPRRAVYYPFAVFSPEWQAISFGYNHRVPVRFMDLPQTNWLALSEAREKETLDERSENETETVTNSESEDKKDTDNNLADSDVEAETADPDKTVSVTERTAKDDLSAISIRRDPLHWLATAAGYSDSERWWEHMVEHRSNNRDLFLAIKEAMTSLRSEIVDPDPDAVEPLREAHMRQTIRTAIKEGFKKIAVVCGAWHVPALDNMPPAKEDAALLKGLPKIKVESTWIPWTNGRLTFASGYGAGVNSPGWYHHLWTCNGLVAEKWMSRVARLLREEDMDASSANVIESVRLAECLAALRGRPLAGLEELMEAGQSVLCFGNEVPLKIIQNKLIVGEELGAVPEETPSIPLQKDLERQQKRLRIPAEATEKIYELDLRKEMDLDRSHLLHRLDLIGTPWGRIERQTAKVKGTFREHWRVKWHPEFSIRIIDAARWGKTVGEAAANFAADLANKSKSLPELTTLLDRALLSDIPVEHIMQRVENEAAIASDITHLMAAVPPLSNIARYGNVRKTDLSSVDQIIDGLVTRISAGLASSCASLNDEAAQDMFNHINELNSAITLLQKADLTQLWHEPLFKLAQDFNIHGIISGRACRLLRDAGQISEADAATRIGLALSQAVDPVNAANWAEGFLSGSGLVLIHDEPLFAAIDDWLSSLNDAVFTNVLPLMRRTFSTFAKPERRQMGERVVAGHRPAGKVQQQQLGIDSKRADAALEVVALCLGLSPPQVQEGD